MLGIRKSWVEVMSNFRGRVEIEVSVRVGVRIRFEVRYKLN